MMYVKVRNGSEFYEFQLGRWLLSMLRNDILWPGVDYKGYKWSLLVVRVGVQCWLGGNQSVVRRFEMSLLKVINIHSRCFYYDKNG